MSGHLAGKVWLSDLDANLKPLAATLADLGGDDGSSIYPSVEYICWRLGKAESTVREGLRSLREMGILTIIGSGKGGRGKVTHYQMVEENLPKRDEWKVVRARIKGTEIGYFMNELEDKPSGRPSKPSSQPSKTLQPTGGETLVEPLEEPPLGPSLPGKSFSDLRKTFARKIGVSVSRNKHTVAQYEKVVRVLGADELHKRLVVWLDQAGDRYKDKLQKKYAVYNFFEEVEDFEIEDEPETVAPVRRKSRYPKL